MLTKVMTSLDILHRVPKLLATAPLQTFLIQFVVHGFQQNIERCTLSYHHT